MTSGGTTETKMVPSAIWRVASALATTPQRHERKLSCAVRWVARVAGVRWVRWVMVMRVVWWWWCGGGGGRHRPPMELRVECGCEGGSVA